MGGQVRAESQGRGRKGAALKKVFNYKSLTQIFQQHLIYTNPI